MSVKIRLTSLIAAASLALSAGGVRAALVFSDTFTKPDGALSGTTPDVGGAWTPTGNPPSTVNPVQIAGGAAAILTTGQDLFSALSTAITPIAGDSMVTSMDINVSAAQATGDYFSHVMNPAAATATAFYQRLFVRSATGGFQLGLLDTSGTGNTTTWGTGVLNLSQAYHVDVTWNFVSGSNNDTFAVTVNGNPYLTHTWTSATGEPATIAAANLRQGSATAAPTLTVDNYAINTVPVPEPASVMLVLAAAGCLAARRR